MKSGRVQSPGAPQRVVAVFLALAVVLTQAYRAWAHCTLTVTASPAKVCVGEPVTVVRSGIDCQGQSVNETNTTSYGTTGPQIICPSPGCGGCGLDTCATVMVVAVESVLPASATLCAGSSNTFSITTTPTGETLPSVPDWTVTPAGAGNIVGSGTSVVFVAANTGVVATVTAGCGSSSAAATVTILTNHWSGWTVSNAPTISVTVSGEVASCAITTATFTAAISTNTGLCYRSDMNGCAPTNEVSDLVLTNLVTTWNVTGPNAASGSGTQAMFTVSNPGTNMITFTTSGETLDPAGTYSTNAVATNVSYVVTLTPAATNVCVNCTNTFVASAAPGGAGTFTWTPIGQVVNSLDGTTSSNSVVFTSAGLNQLVTVSYGACTKTATAHVFEVTSVVWSNAVNALDTNPNAGSGKRIYPDRADPAAGPHVSNQWVWVVATVNPPTNGVVVNLRVLDVDDPSTNGAPVDANNDTGDDNRSDGVAPNAGSLAATTVVTDTNGVARTLLTVSRQPGNNFRVAASCETNTLAKLTVTNSIPNTIYVPADNVVTLTGLNGKLTEMLTVWRRLRVELDSMSNVVANVVTGAITSLTGPSNHVATLNVNLQSGLAPPDNSLNQDTTPAGNGRFESGVVAIGITNATPLAGRTTSGLIGNGTNTIVAPLLDIPFLVTNSAVTLSGSVLDMTPANNRTTFTVSTTGNLNQINAGDWISVAGVTGTVLGRSPGQKKIWVGAGFVLPFWLHDDDDDSLLPRAPDTGLLAAALAQAYVVPMTFAGNNTNITPFLLNVQFDNAAIGAAQRWDSRFLNSDDFWVAYVLAAFQGDLLGDLDPSGETNSLSTALGVTPSDGRGGSLIYRELHQVHEGLTNPTLEEQDTVVHEVGHALGRSGAEPVTLYPGNPGVYTNTYLNVIRSASRPEP